MTVRAATYALDLRLPYLMERGLAQDLAAPIRHGVGGPLVAPSSGTVTITRPDGTTLVSAAAVTITSSIATYAVTPTAAETLGEGWVVEWALTISSLPYTFRSRAMLCEHLLYPVVAESHLYEREPELRHAIPADQTATGWQSQIDDAWYEMQDWLIQSGHRPWLIMEPTALRLSHLTRALELCCRAASSGADSANAWGMKAETYRHEHRNARGSLRLAYETEDPTTRRAASPTVRLAPVGRPWC